MKLEMPNMSRKNLWGRVRFRVRVRVRVRVRYYSRARCHQQAIRLRRGVVKVPACSASWPTPPEAKAKSPQSAAHAGDWYASAP